jgi:short-subunit dehydrogenase
LKKVIIIGATSGIGRELAKLYLRSGWKVAITGRRKDLLDSFLVEHQNDPKSLAHESNVYASCFDVRSENNLSHLRSLIQQLGGLDLLIYNPGYGEVSKTLDWELDKATFETNVKGFIEIVNFAFNFFVDQGSGHIAATSSVAANRGNSWSPAYSASKAFMSNYMEGLHMKARKMKVNVAITDIQPGFVDTKMAKGNGRFWITPVKKAAKHIYKAIEAKRWRAYVSPRWWLIAQIMKWAPGWLYHRVG